MTVHPQLSSPRAAWLGLAWLAGAGLTTWVLTVLAATATQPGSISVFVAVLVTPIVAAILAWQVHHSLRLFLWVAIWCGVAQAIGFLFLLAMLALLYFTGANWHPG